MSYFNINFIIDEFLLFLKINQHIVHEEHFAEAMESISFIKRFEKDYCSNSSKSFHYPSCPTNCLPNRPEEGPDTCACYEIKFNLSKIKGIVHFYKTILNE